MGTDTAGVAGRVQQVRWQWGSSAAALTGQIKKMATIKELVRMHHANEGGLNDIHLSAC